MSVVLILKPNPSLPHTPGMCLAWASQSKEGRERGRTTQHPIMRVQGVARDSTSAKNRLKPVPCKEKEEQN